MTDDLLVSYLLNEVNDEGRKKVEHWISEDQQNLGYFENFRLIWETSQNIGLPVSIDPDDAWQRFKKRTEKVQPGPATIKRISAYTWPLRIAAAIIISISILGLLYYSWDKISDKPVTFASLELSKVDTLPDGSVVTLNKHSEIIYQTKFSRNRKIKLKGEAFFNVAPDKTHPFTIDVNDIRVTVVGTSFNIKSINGNTELVVETGIVKVEKNGRTITVRPGEKLLTETRKDSVSKSATTDRLYNYYRSHEFVCDDTPLWKLVEVLNEAYDAHIVIENKSIRSLPLTTTFYNEPLEKILSIISETFNIKVERNGNTIMLK